MSMYRFSSYVVLLALLAGCSNSAGSSGSAQSGTTISLAGSTALQPLVAKAAQDYMATHPSVTIKVAGGGSGTGLAALFANSVDVADSDVEAPKGDVTDHEVAVAPFAIVVGPGVITRSLTVAQIRDIFFGKIKNWSDVQGGTAPIVIVNRPMNSGTRKVFSTTVLGGAEPIAARTEESNEKVAEAVRNAAGSISYVGLDFAQKFNLPTVAIGGVKPELKNVETGKYPYWSYEHMYTNARSTSAAADFITFVRNQNSSIDQLGFIAMSDMQLANR